MGKEGFVAEAVAEAEAQELEKGEAGAGAEAVAVAALPAFGREPPLRELQCQQLTPHRSTCLRQAKGKATRKAKGRAKERPKERRAKEKEIATSSWSRARAHARIAPSPIHVDTPPRLAMASSHIGMHRPPLSVRFSHQYLLPLRKPRRQNLPLSPPRCWVDFRQIGSGPPQLGATQMMESSLIQLWQYLRIQCWVWNAQTLAPLWPPRC